MFLEETKPLKRRPVYEFGEFQLDTAERTLRRAKEPVAITPKALETLLALIERRGAVVEKDELMRAIWPGTFVEETNLTFNISMLRKALAPFECIETIPRRGYRFTAEVREAGAPSAQPTPALPATRRAMRRRLIASGALAVLIAAAAATRYAGQGSQPRTLAILPFQSLDPAHPEETLQLGLADALITKLGTSPGLIVCPTSAVRRYSAPGADPLAAGRDLAADSVLAGAFQRSAGRVRLTAQLIDIPTGRHLWDGQFDAQDGELLALEDEAAERIAGALSVRFPQAKRRPSNSPAPAVYENYLRGRIAHLQWSESGARQAADYFESVVKADPEWAPGYVGLADATEVLIHWGVLSPAEATPRAAAAVRRAIALDDSLADAHLALGAIALLHDWDRDSARTEIRRALELSPNTSQTHGLLATLAILEGRNDEALRERRVAFRLDPRSTLNRVGVGWPYYFARRYDEAIAEYRKSLEIDPGFPAAYWSLAESLEGLGKHAEAADACGKAAGLSGRSARALACLGHALGRAGRRSEALAVLDELDRQSRSRYVSPMFRAMVYAGIGDKDQAFAMLENSLRERSDWMMQFPIWPLFDTLRPDPRYADIVSRIRPLNR